MRSGTVLQVSRTAQVLALVAAGRVVTRTEKAAKVILPGTIDSAVALTGIGATKGAKAAIEAAGGSLA